MKSSAVMAFAVALLAAPSAFAAVGAWGHGAKADVRLIAAGIGADGKLDAGIEIVMPAGWHTYWRSPGDAGFAPEFDFAASVNFGEANVSFPVPERYDDGFSVTNIYRDRVVLLLSAVAVDKSEPVEIVLRMRLGVCDEICVPDEVEARLTIPAGENDTVAGATLADIRASLPGVPEPGVFTFDVVAREGGTDKRPVFRITGVVPAPKDAILFVEGPADWAPYTPELVASEGGKAAWTVKFSRLGAKAPIEGARFRLTLVSGGRAIDQTLTLE